MGNNYDAIIIGAGIGGLTCGNFLAKHGMRVLILEQHFQPGGYCTSYKRKGHLFDVPTFWCDLGDGSSGKEILSYLGIYNKLKLRGMEKIARFDSAHTSFVWHAGWEKFEQELLDKFPHEERGIKKYFKTLKVLKKKLLNTYYKPSRFRLFTYLFSFPQALRYKNISCEQFFKKFFKDEELIEGLGSLCDAMGGAMSDTSALLYLSFIVCLGDEDSTWTFFPEGGFQLVADTFADSFKNYGGVLKLKARVKRILVEDGNAVGVKLENGEEIFGNYIISNADTKRTFFELIGSEKLSKKVARKISTMKQSISGVIVNLLLDMKFPDVLKGVPVFIYSEPGCKDSMYHDDQNNINLEKYSIIIESPATSILEGDVTQSDKFILKLFYMPAPYGYKNRWAAGDKEAYNRLKDEIADKLIKDAEQFIPGLSKHIIFKDVCTPLTYERYTSATDGAWYDIDCKEEKRYLGETPIKNLYLTGGKLVSGIPGAISGALITADTILKGQLSSGKWFLRRELLQK